MKVFCFDLDDTLVGERQYVLSGLAAAGAHAERAMGMAPGTAAAWLQDAWARTGAPDVFQRWLVSVGRPANHPLLGELVSAYRDHQPQLTFRPGALEVLETLVRSGHRLALITDGHLDVQRRKWTSLACPFQVEPVVFTDERGRAFWKPNEWAYRFVMDRWPEATGFVYVGDNPAKDFHAPRRLGWQTAEVWSPDNIRPRQEGPGIVHGEMQFDSLNGVLELK